MMVPSVPGCAAPFDLAQANGVQTAGWSHPAPHCCACVHLGTCNNSCTLSGLCMVLVLQNALTLVALLDLPKTQLVVVGASLGTGLLA
jgi:hypothetical protein